LTRYRRSGVSFSGVADRKLADVAAPHRPDRASPREISFDGPQCFGSFARLIDVLPTRGGEGVLSFEAFVAAHLHALLGLSIAITADPFLGEDLVQDVLLKAHQRWELVSQAEDPAAYVRRMLINEHVSWRRKWARLVPVADASLAASLYLDGDRPDLADTHAERAALAARLRELSGRQRVVLAMRYYAGMSDEEIAAELGCGVSAVRSYASRALARLRESSDPAPKRGRECGSHA
jgi:RNA polymerase sigma-70 factor (sigma-E family)